MSGLRSFRRVKRARSLTSRIVTEMAAIAAGGALLVTLAAGVYFYRDGVADATLRTGANAATMANELSLSLNAAARTVRENQRLLEAALADQSSRAATVEILRRSLADNRRAEAAWLIAEPGAIGPGEFQVYWRRRADGSLAFDNDRSPDRSAAYYLDPVARDDLVVSQPYTRRVASNGLVSMTRVAAPLRVDGRLRGVTGVDLFRGKLSRRLLAAAQSDDARFALLSDAGVVILSSDPALLGRPLAGLPADRATISSAAEAGGRGVIGKWAAEDAIVVVQPVAFQGSNGAWTLIVAEPTAGALGNVREALGGAALVGLALVALSSLVALRLGKNLSLPLERMAGAVREMADGHMQAPIPAGLIDIELADMARALEAYRACAQDLVEAEGARRAAERTAGERAVQLKITSSNLPLDPFIRLVAEEAMALTCADGAAVALLSGEALAQHVSVGALNRKSRHKPILNAFATLAMRAGETLVCRDCRTDERLDRHAAVASTVLSLVATPLMEGGRALGVLSVTSAEADAFTQQHASALQGLSPFIAAALSRELARDAAEAANRAKSEFLANVSHEIRTPLNGILGMADMLSRARLQPREREMAEIIRSSGDTLDRLLSDILDLARIEEGKVTIEHAPFHLGDAVRTVAKLSRVKAKEKGVRLTVDVAPEVDRMFIGDGVRIRQVATNLVSNAVKFTGEGLVSVRVTAAEGGARLEVEDTGVGFDPARKDQVFGRFQQADGSITRRFGGSGLGLAISRNLAALMGGTLDCETIEGEGSRFWMELPLEPAEAVADQRLEALRPETSTAAIRILAADDHPTNRKVVDLIMADAGVELVTVVDGREALERFTTERFDLVLMDMQMPVMDGLSATRAIRLAEQERRLERTPILMLTANALPEHVASAYAAGADGHVAKPITPAALLGAVARALDAPATPQSEVA